MLVPKLIEYLGVDQIIQAGGGIHGHPDGTVKGATAFRQAVEATLAGISLKEYSKDHRELAKALSRWAV
jgi:ribulose-bisphosphate carboxylase large chain